MLNIKTKNSIDKARSILVGKIPSPSAQVEQITLAMLYKFMDDMDQESVNLGGRATFFTGDYEQFSWKNIMSQMVSAQVRYNKYTEALEKFYTHPSLPQTFKDVFKNATVPFKEADILTMFLKEIDDGLSYEDSEQLGDAYEYLLSVLGSQGDLGQFRTPRHIIDMIVEIVDPKKTDTILDPACGTAGFLISAYKHIIKENTDKTPGDMMNFDEKMEVLRHITGYDIEPSMVRIAEMNMFLHGASDPDIHEYDTLTDDSKWEEKFNVILANPPFMTPKGGIKPHNKFGIKASRSEVLFVDYITSHLRMDGRAGIIVPEGIVYQSGKAFAELRKNLVSSSLVAVISLPQGVFNPYSGIKTCILIVDKKVAKLTDKILFVELNNDGFSLGAQRIKITENDIPAIINLLKEYTADITNEKMKSEDEYTQIYNDIKFVAKDDINEKLKYSLESNKYIKDKDNYTGSYEMKSIGELFDSGRGRVISKEFIKNNSGDYPVYSSQTQNNGVLGYINTYDFDEEMITWTTDGANAGTVFYRTGKFNCTNVCGTLKLKQPNNNINLKYVVIALNRVAKKYVSIASGNPKLMNNVMESIRIPIPPIEVQEELVGKVNQIEAEINELNKKIDECDKKIQNEVDQFWR